MKNPIRIERIENGYLIFYDSMTYQPLISYFKTWEELANFAQSYFEN